MKKTVLIFFILMFSISSVFATGDDIDQQEEMLELIEERLNQLDDSHRDFVNQKNAKHLFSQKSIVK